MNVNSTKMDRSFCQHSIESDKNVSSCAGESKKGADRLEDIEGQIGIGFLRFYD